MIKTVKAGGTSLANSTQIEKFANIVRNDPTIKYIVASAPGKSNISEEKVTNLLEENNKEKVIKVFNEICNGLNLNLIGEITSQIYNAKTKEELVSRGEYCNSKILANYLGFEFIDAKDLIFIKDNSAENIRTRHSIEKKLVSSDKKFVLGGFYGSDYLGNTVLFPKGYGDYTGSIITAYTDSEIYENWTDKDGVHSADPNIVENTRLIKKMSYKELRELTYMGFSVFNDKSIYPLKKENKPIHIRNTNNPFSQGTWISQEYEKETVRGIGGKKGFCLVNIEKYLMNEDIGYGSLLLEILHKNRISYEHIPSGIDEISLIVDQNKFNNHWDKVIGDIKQNLPLDNLTVIPDVSLISIVGEELLYYPEIYSKIGSVLQKEKIIMPTHPQGSRTSIILSVQDKDYLRVMNSLHKKLISS